MLRVFVLLLSGLFLCSPAQAQEKPLPLVPPVPQLRLQERPLRARPSDLDAEFERAASAFRSGVSLLEAKARVDRVLRTLPGDVEALKLRAQILVALDRPEEALGDVRLVLERFPEDGEAHLIVSEAATQAGEQDTARSAMNAAANLLPDSAELWTRLARVAVFNNRTVLAQAYARRAATAAPLGARAYYQVAMLLVQRSQDTDAAETLRIGLEEGVLDPVWIRQHPVLAPLARHERLKAYF